MNGYPVVRPSNKSIEREGRREPIPTPSEHDMNYSTQNLEQYMRDIRTGRGRYKGGGNDQLE